MSFFDDDAMGKTSENCHQHRRESLDYNYKQCSPIQRGLFDYWLVYLGTYRAISRLQSLNGSNECQIIGVTTWQTFTGNKSYFWMTWQTFILKIHGKRLLIELFEFDELRSTKAFKVSQRQKVSFTISTASITTEQHHDGRYLCFSY